ncbi:MAG: transcriptional repressor [Spirochaetales bacterium]|nr:transcriptional repressor [Spirochaetales bacterium]
MNETSNLLSRLSSLGIRLTPAREEVVNILTATDEHLSAEDIFFRIHSKDPSIGLTTVYRTLELFEQNNIVTKFEFGHGRAKFELSEEFSHKKHHHHLVCTKCRKIIDYSDFLNEEQEYVEKTERGLENKYAFKINCHIIHFYGICGDCV